MKSIYGQPMRGKTLLAIALICPTMAFSADLDKGIRALVQVESRGIASAVNGNAVGILQIKPIQVKEINRILTLQKADKRYTLQDRLCPVKSKEMAYIFYGFWIKRWPKMTDAELCGRWMMPNGKAPAWYIERCRKAMEE
jgi:hypothetical protein